MSWSPKRGRGHPHGQARPPAAVLTLIGLAVVALIGAVAFAYLWQQRAAERAQHEQTARETASAAELCTSGSHAARGPFRRTGRALSSDAAVQRAREQCGMRWLREIRVRVGEQTFADIVKRVQPVLVAGAT